MIVQISDKKLKERTFYFFNILQTFCVRIVPYFGQNVIEFPDRTQPVIHYNCACLRDLILTTLI